jgi:methylated-DNA-[protein]-cysteine S-methyltransferase
MLESLVAECAPDLKVRLTATGSALRSIGFVRDGDLLSPEKAGDTPAGPLSSSSPILAEALRQLRAYFAGSLREFTLPLDPQGTEFQKRVWRELQTRPFGEGRSYSQIAEAIGAPKAVRAVGAANGANPLAVVVPCHRVIGSSGKLVGYGGGLPLKKLLLDLEGCTMVLFRT